MAPAHLTARRTEPRKAPRASAHAVKAAIEEARRGDAEGKARVILFNLSGHGHFDLGAYDQYFAGELEDFEYPREAVEKAMEGLPKVEM
jgi:tryptophan synthase beta chain